MRCSGPLQAALLALLLLLLDPSKGAFAAPNNGSAALAKAASEKEVLPTPEDPRDADGEEAVFLSVSFLCRAGPDRRQSESSRESAFLYERWP